MDGAGAGGAARERRNPPLTSAEAVNHKRQLAQMLSTELALIGGEIAEPTDF